MFSDLELAIVALVLVFTLGCIMLERKNNNARERTPTRKPTRMLRNSFNPAPLVQTNQEDCIFRCFSFS